MEERLRHLEERMDERFARFSAEVKAGFDRVDAEVKLRFKVVDERFDRIDDQMKELRAEIKGLHTDNKAILQAMNEGFARVHSNMVIGFATIVAALIGTAAF